MKSIYSTFIELTENEDQDDVSFGDMYNPAEILRELIEIIRDKDDESGDSGENGEIDPALEIIHEVADKLDDDVIEEIIEGLFDYYLDDDDLDDAYKDAMEKALDLDLDEQIELVEEIDGLDLISEKVSAVQKKRMRFLKKKRRKALGKRGDSMAFKRTHKFDSKKKKFVKRKTAMSVSGMRKKARIFKKTMRKGSSKTKAKRMKKRLKNVKNPYGN